MVEREHKASFETLSQPTPLPVNVLPRGTKKSLEDGMVEREHRAPFEKLSQSTTFPEARKAILGRHG